jgi:preprotein translocase subunit SecY
MIVLWLSELITEYGIGNGPSLIIYTNIISNLSKLFNNIKYHDISFVSYTIIGLLLSLTISGLILLQEGIRIIPLISSKQANKIRNSVTNNIETQKNYIPIRLNQSGIMPIILTTTFLTGLTNINFFNRLFSCNNIIISLILKIFYWIIYFVLILFFLDAMLG